MPGKSQSSCAGGRIEARRFRGWARPFPPHRHAGHVIGIVREGRRSLTCNGTPYDIGPGDIVIFNPGDAHGCEQQGEEPLSYDSVVIATLPEGGSAGEALLLGGPVVRDEEAARLLDELLTHVEEEAVDEADETLCLLADHLAAKADGTGSVAGIEPGSANRAGDAARTSAGAAPDDPLARAAAHLRAQLARPVRLDDLAAIAGMSRWQLVRAWRRRFGLTPMQHLASLRVERARALLAQGRSCAEAAHATGFSDQPHLTRAFRDRLGITPGAYRDALAGADDTSQTTRAVDIRTADGRPSAQGLDRGGAR
ncbi:MAG: AraC family transcriptional regulator [Eggerthellaceae bacterium]|nr:AraC family transcriptional regulator [Eggerthellaceae bacterium]